MIPECLRKKKTAQSSPPKFVASSIDIMTWEPCLVYQSFAGCYLDYLVDLHTAGVFQQANLNHWDPKKNIAPGGSDSLPKCSFAAQNLVLSSGRLGIWGSHWSPNGEPLKPMTHDLRCVIHVSCPLVWWLRECSSMIVKKLSYIGNMVLLPSFNGGSFGSKTSTFLHLVLSTNGFGSADVSDLLGMLLPYQAVLEYFAPHALAVSLCRELMVSKWIYPEICLKAFWEAMPTTGKKWPGSVQHLYFNINH